MEQALIDSLAGVGIVASSELPLHLNTQPFAYPARGWASAGQPTASVAEVFGNRAEFANRIIKIAGMQECGRASRYVNLSFAGKQNVAQIHPQSNGIALVLCSTRRGLRRTPFRQMPVKYLAGYTGQNALWLDGKGRLFASKGPAAAFLIPDEIATLDDSAEWREVAKLLDFAKTLK